MDLQDYLNSHTDSPTDILNDIEKNTHQFEKRPHMLSGPYQGRFLSMMSKMVSPNKILEIGTFTGYSALCLAEGLKDGGELHTIERDLSIAKIARSNFDRYEYGSKIILHLGDAIEVLRNIKVVFDFIFIDANKNKYIEYYKMSLSLLNSGGYILVDNVLWKNQVFDPSFIGDKYTQVMNEFNDFVRSDTSVEKIMLPIRDGLYLIRKK